MTGAQMAREMGEQPARLRALIGRIDEIDERVRAIAPSPMAGITIVARGSSDHAAVYGRYLLEAATGKPVSLAAPSLHTLYEIDVDYRDQLVIAVSQSGATPESVRTLRALRAGGGRGAGDHQRPRERARAGRRRGDRPGRGRGAGGAGDEDRHRTAHRVRAHRLRPGTRPLLCGRARGVARRVG